MNRTSWDSSTRPRQPPNRAGPRSTAEKRQQEIERENDLWELIQWLVDTAEQETT